MGPASKIEPGAPILCMSRRRFDNLGRGSLRFRPSLKGIPLAGTPNFPGGKTAISITRHSEIFHEMKPPKPFITSEGITSTRFLVERIGSFHGASPLENLCDGAWSGYLPGSSSSLHTPSDFESFRERISSGMVDVLSEVSE